MSPRRAPLLLAMFAAWPSTLPAAELPGWAVPLLPGVGQADRRVVVDADARPWRAIVRVQTELGSRCTGVLLGPRAVVTAAHCLFLARPRRFIRPRSVHVVIGYQRGRFAGHSRAADYTLGPGYDPLDGERSAGADWAVLRLAAPLGGADRILPLAPSAEPGEPAVLAGYDMDRAEVIEADPRCKISARVADAAGHPLLADDCEATRGVSGAPLLVRSGNGWAVAGIQVRALAGRAGGFAVPTSAFAATVSAAATNAAAGAPTGSAAAPSSAATGADRSR